MKWNSGRLWLRVIVYSLVIMISLAVLAQSLIFWQFDESKIKDILTKSLTESHRQVTIEGRISPSIFPSPGIDVGKVSISEPNSTVPFAQIAEIDIHLAWLPLIMGRKEVKSVVLHGFSAAVTRQKDGRLSIGDLFQRRSQNTFSVKLDSLSIREGTLVYSDQVSQWEHRLENISLDADDLRSSATLSAGAVLADRKTPIRLAINTPLTIQDDQVNLDKLEAVALSDVQGLGESKLLTTGQFKLNFATMQTTGSNLALTFSSEHPSSHITLAIPTLTASLTDVTMPTGQLHAKLEYAKSRYQLDSTLDNLKLNTNGLFADRVKGDFNWSAGSTNLNLKLNAPFSLVGMKQLHMQPIVLNGMLTTPSLPRGKLPSSLTGTLDGNLDDPRFDLRVAGKLDGSDMSLNLSQYGFMKPRHEATLTVGKLDLNRYLPENKGNSVAIFQDTNPIPLDWLDFFDLTGKLSIGELNVGRFKVNHVVSNVLASPQELELTQMSADIYEGTLQGDVQISRNGTPKLQVKQTLKGMNIQPLLVDLINFNQLDGKGNGQVNILATGTSFAELRNNLSGTVQLSLNKGALTGIDLVAALKNLSAELQDEKKTIPTGQKTTFSALSASFHVDKGIAKNQDMKLASQLVNVNGNGKVDLKQNIIDYTLDVKANPNEFTQYKDVNVPLKITGPINAPVYALDFNAMVKGKKTENEKQQALKQELKKQITTILP